jgi:hypothetical protein
VKKLEYGLCALLALGGAGHLAGTFAGYEPGTETFAWSLSASAFVFTLVALHLLRLGRPGDWPLALTASVATLAWAAVALMFGRAIGDVLDPRVLIHVAVSLLLAALALRRVPAVAAARA